MSNLLLLLVNACDYNPGMRLLRQAEFEAYLGIPRASHEWQSLSPHLDPEALLVEELDQRELMWVAEAVRKRIGHDHQRVGIEARQDTWEDGWNENLRLWEQCPTWLSLQPRYYTSERSLRSPVSGFPVFRLNGEFVTSARVDFEIHAAEAYRSLMFDFLGSRLEPNLVVELGCGSGLNVLALGREFPRARLLAADYVNSALRCAEQVGSKEGIELATMKFDFQNPPAIQLPKGSLAITMGALEQIGKDRHSNMLEWILRQSGVWFFHSEPFVEMYSSDDQMDELLNQFVKRRGYSSGILTDLRSAAAAGKLAEYHETRVLFGSAFLEGYNWALYEVA